MRTAFNVKDTVWIGILCEEKDPESMCSPSPGKVIGPVTIDGIRIRHSGVVYDMVQGVGDGGSGFPEKSIFATSELAYEAVWGTMAKKRGAGQ